MGELRGCSPLSPPRSRWGPETPMPRLQVSRSPCPWPLAQRQKPAEMLPSKLQQVKLNLRRTFLVALRPTQFCYGFKKTFRLSGRQLGRDTGKTWESKWKHFLLIIKVSPDGCFHAG